MSGSDGSISGRPSRSDKRRLELIEASAWRQIQSAVSPAFKEQFGVSVRADSGTVSIRASRTNQLALNRVFGLGVSTPLTAERLGALIDEYVDVGAPRFLVSWSPIAQPAGARHWFAERGFRRITGIAKLARRTVPELQATSDLQTIETSQADAEQFGTTAALGNGLPLDFAPGFHSTMGHPGWRHYFAVDGTRPVGAAALYVDGDVAWAGFAGTLPADRGRGAQSILLAHRVRDAHALGARWITCETTAESPERPNQSLRNMKRLGFDVVHELENFVLDLSAY